MAGEIRTETDGAVGTIVFDHPERRNAISVDMWRQLPLAVARLADDATVRVVVLRGAGDVAFVAGADISEFQSSRSGDSALRYDADSAVAFLALQNLEKPLIASIHGFCIGGGVAIALTADLRYASEDAKLGIPAARLGLGYHLQGVESLVNVVGYSRAKEIFYTARRFTAAEALRMGLLNDVFAKAELDQRVRDIAEQIADNAPLTLRCLKISARELAKPAPQRDYDAVNRALGACFQSSDYLEGVRAFLEKRPPRFEGK